MKKSILLSFLFICISIYAKAQFNVFDSTTVLGVTTSGNYFNYLSASTPLNAPVGPDYSAMLVNKHPKWFRWTVCGTDQSNYVMSNQIYGISDTASIAVWGPFADTININNKLNATHLNIAVNSVTSSSTVYFNVPHADSLGIYIMLICTSDTNANVNGQIDILNPINSPLHMDSRCGICTGFVNYEQQICAVTYDTAYKKYMVLWDKQNNYGVASFNILKSIGSNYNLIGNVPVTAPSIFMDPGFNPMVSTVDYQLKAVDSCGNTMTILYPSNLSVPFANCNKPNDNTSQLSSSFPSIQFPPPSHKFFIYRGPSESSMSVIDSTYSNYWTDQFPPQGLCYYSFAFNNVAGCHPDTSTTINEVRTNTTLVQHICLVAFDSTLQKNVVVWDKQDNSDVAYFNIYREGAVLNQFDSIGFVLESDPALFVDIAVNPNTKSYKYLVRPVDLNGMVLSENNSGSHTTIHMQASAGLFGEVNLSWNPYAGFTYATYYINRGTSTSTMQIIDSIASNVTSYTDYSANAGLNFYRVTVRNLYGCHPDSSSAVYEAHSNPSYAVVTGISDPLAQQIKLYPNPTHDYALLDYSALPYITRFEIINSLGNIVQSLNGNLQNKISINTTTLNKGVYYITAKTDKGMVRKKLVVF